MHFYYYRQYLKQYTKSVLAAELLNALENSIRGQSINLEIILKSCNAVTDNGEKVSFIFYESNLKLL